MWTRVNWSSCKRYHIGCSCLNRCPEVCCCTKKCRPHLNTHVLGIFSLRVKWGVTEIALFDPTPPCNHTPTHSSQLSGISPAINCFYQCIAQMSRKHPPHKKKHQKNTAVLHHDTPWVVLHAKLSSEVTCSVTEARLHPGVTDPPMVYHTAYKRVQMHFRGKWWPVRVGLDPFELTHENHNSS